MAITKQKKEEVVGELAEAFKNAHLSIFADFQGTNVETLNDLRSKIRKTDGSVKVAKKTLFKRALESAGLTGIDPRELKGEVAVVFGMQDVVSTSKAIYEVSKTMETLKILGGFMDGVVLSVGDITQLASVPSRQELLTRLVGSINTPRVGFVRVMFGNVRGLVCALNAIAQK